MHLFLIFYLQPEIAIDNANLEENNWGEGRVIGVDFFF
jgi:hypothetical protein